MDLWQTRTDATAYLQSVRPERLACVIRIFDLLDQCVSEFESAVTADAYARLCGLSLLKIKNLALGSFSLDLDGLGQEAGALMRPMLEYGELLTYFRMFPEGADQTFEDKLPSAGKRAEKIGGIYKQFRDHLNDHAAHSSFSSYSISHLLEPSTLKFKKLQRAVPHVLDANCRDLALILLLVMRQAILSLEPAGSPRFLAICESADTLKLDVLRAFDLENK